MPKEVSFEGHSLEELLKQLLCSSSGAADEDSDEGDLCLVRGEGDAAWYWADEELDER